MSLNAMRATTQQGSLNVPALNSILHLQTSIANAECVVALQLFDLFLGMEKKLEAINTTYKIPAKKSTMTTKPPLEILMNQLRKIVKEVPQPRVGDFA